MNKQVTMTLPEAPGFEYTGEYRRVNQDEYFLNGNNKAESCHIQQTAGMFPILRRKKILTDFEYNLKATEIYRTETIRMIPAHYEMDEFRYPNPGEIYMSRNGVIATSAEGDRDYFFYPVLILKRID